VTDQADENGNEVHEDWPRGILGCTEDTSLQLMGNDDAEGKMDIIEVQTIALDEVAEKVVEKTRNTFVGPDVNMVLVEGGSELSTISTAHGNQGRVLSPEKNEEGFEIPDAVGSPILTSNIPNMEDSSVDRGDRCVIYAHMLQKCSMSRETVGKEGMGASSIQTQDSQTEEQERPVQETWEP
jgi:hypothetical protein